MVNFEVHENHISHETKGLSEKHLVVRRGKPFKVTLLLGGRLWDPYNGSLVLEVWLGMKDMIKFAFTKARTCHSQKKKKSLLRNTLKCPEVK